MKLKKSTQIVIGVLASIILISILASSGEAEATSTEKKSSTEAVAAADTKTEESSAPADVSPALFDSPEDFRKAFNKAARETSFEYKIDEIDIIEGKVNNTFSYMFNKNIGLIGTINKTNGSLKEISMLGRSDGSGNSAADMLGLMAAIIATADPDLPPSGRGEILKELKLFGDDAADLKDHSANTDKNGIHYFITSSELMGIMFGASRK